MAGICPHCRERPATTRQEWWLVFPLMLFTGGGTSERLCRDCAGGRNFLGALLLAVILIAAFVVAVIVW